MAPIEYGTRIRYTPREGCRLGVSQEADATKFDGYIDNGAYGIYVQPHKLLMGWHVTQTQIGDEKFYCMVHRDQFVVLDGAWAN